jgi:NAD-dependent SIR2 family protein deacetylase
VRDSTRNVDKRLQQAARAIDEASAMYIGAGAGMGVDSGLPDFRGDQGFWRAYPPFQELGLNFMDLANPDWFSRDPELAWGFYGHRLHLYRETVPHTGFERLLDWGEAKDDGYYIFTSNVDGQFQAAHFADQRIVECHGSIHHLQCIDQECIDPKCTDAHVWSAHSTNVKVDASTFRATPPLPRCPKCNTLARPNILMFGDSAFIGARTHAQQKRMSDWLRSVGDKSVDNKKIVIIECGAGTAVPTVRRQCERLVGHLDATLVRINPREAQGPAGTISLPLGAEDALGQIDALLDD